MAFLCLKTKAFFAISDVKKYQTSGIKASRAYLSLKPRCHGGQPTRSIIIHRNIGSTLTQEISRSVNMVFLGGGAGQRFHVRRSLLLVERLINTKSVFFSGSVPVFPTSCCRQKYIRLEFPGSDVQWCRIDTPKCPPERAASLLHKVG